MKITYSHFIAVPARHVTFNPELMALLAKQIEYLKPEKIAVVALPEGKEEDVVETAKLLYRALIQLGLAGTFEVRQIENQAFGPTDSGDEKIKHVLKIALEPAPEADVLVLVLDLTLAEKISRVFIWDFLGNHEIDLRLDHSLRPGEAAIVTCKDGTRNALHPEGYMAWAQRALAGLA